MLFCRSYFFTKMHSRVAVRSLRCVSLRLNPFVTSFTQVRSVSDNESFLFDQNRVPDTFEKERKKFEDHAELFGDNRFWKKIDNKKWEFVATQNPEEWKYVDRLVEAAKSKTVPVPKLDSVAASGFLMPLAKPKDYTYFVRRTLNHMLPVYVSKLAVDNNGASDKGITITSVKKVEGDVFKLREDLCEFLLQRYEQEFISQPDELRQKVVFRGNFESDFKDFLKLRGF